MSDGKTLCRWETYPYTAHDKRSRTVEHRVCVLTYDSGFVDVLHDRREEATDGEWKTVEAFEVRDHGVRYEKRRDGVLAE